MRIQVSQYRSAVRVVITNDQGITDKGNEIGNSAQGITLDIPLVQALMLAVGLTAEVTSVLRGMLGLAQGAAKQGSASPMTAESTRLQETTANVGDLGSQALSQGPDGPHVGNGKDGVTHPIPTSPTSQNDPNDSA